MHGPRNKLKIRYCSQPLQMLHVHAQCMWHFISFDYDWIHLLPTNHSWGTCVVTFTITTNRIFVNLSKTVVIKYKESILVWVFVQYLGPV